MNKMLKTFISYGLSFLFMSASFHVDLHYQDNYDGIAYVILVAMKRNIIPYLTNVKSV